jgi:hypothetical protein
MRAKRSACATASPSRSRVGMITVTGARSASMSTLQVTESAGPSTQNQSGPSALRGSASSATPEAIRLRRPARALQTSAGPPSIRSVTVASPSTVRHTAAGRAWPHSPVSESAVHAPRTSDSAAEGLVGEEADGAGEGAGAGEASDECADRPSPVLGRRRSEELRIIMRRPASLRTCSRQRRVRPGPLCARARHATPGPLEGPGRRTITR